jgi:hypothetical protein
MVASKPRTAGAQRCGHSVDASSASQSSSLFGVVGRQRQAAVKEESFQPAGERPDRPAGEAGPGQQGLRMIGLLISKQPAEGADHCRGAGRVVTGSEIADEVAKPGGLVSQIRGHSGAPDECAVGMALPT